MQDAVKLAEEMIDSHQSGFGAGQGIGIFHYAAYKIERGGRPFPAARRKFF